GLGAPLRERSEHPIYFTKLCLRALPSRFYLKEAEYELQTATCRHHQRAARRLPISASLNVHMPGA
ncbi:hypothetical protein CE195_12215, partial [Sodalis-like symbiont of Philaenus spumarius]